MSPTKNLKKALKRTKSALGKKAESLTNEVIESAAYKIAETAEPRLEQNVYWRVLRAKQIDTRKLHFLKSFEAWTSEARIQDALKWSLLLIHDFNSCVVFFPP